MATIQLHNDCPNTATSVPNKFIDTYMPEANGEFVKVYLYLLRCMGNHALNCSISTIADCFNHTEKDVVRALKYWERMHLLQLEYNTEKTICGIRFLNLEEASVDYAASADTPHTASARRNPAGTSSAAKAPVSESNLPAADESAAAETVTRTIRRDYTPDEIKAFRKDPNISELFFIIETYLKHPLASTDINTILFWYESLHFSTELIVYLVEYCISKGHSSMRYMDKVAMGWHDSNITTVEQAKENAAIHSQSYYAVMKALGITGRNLVDSETAFIRKWTKDYQFDLPLIQEACGRTIAATHQPSFEYTDSILTNWHKNHVHTLEDIKNLDASFNRTRKVSAATADSGKRNKFNNFNQRNYDYDQLEKVLLTTSVN